MKFLGLLFAFFALAPTQSLSNITIVSPTQGQEVPVGSNLTVQIDSAMNDNVLGKAVTMSIVTCNPDVSGGCLNTSSTASNTVFVDPVLPKSLGILGGGNISQEYNFIVPPPTDGVVVINGSSILNVNYPAVAVVPHVEIHIMPVST